MGASLNVGVVDPLPTLQRNVPPLNTQHADIACSMTGGLMGTSQPQCCGGRPPA